MAHFLELDFFNILVVGFELVVEVTEVFPLADFSTSLLDSCDVLLDLLVTVCFCKCPLTCARFVSGFCDPGGGTVFFDEVDFVTLLVFPTATLLSLIPNSLFNLECSSLTSALSSS